MAGKKVRAKEEGYGGAISEGTGVGGNGGNGLTDGSLRKPMLVGLVSHVVFCPNARRHFFPGREHPASSSPEPERLLAWGRGLGENLGKRPTRGFSWFAERLWALRWGFLPAGMARGNLHAQPHARAAPSLL